MNSEEMNEIRQRCDAATPGEWMAKNKSVRTLKSDGEERPWNTAPTGWNGGICNCLGGNSYASKKGDPINQQAIRNAEFIAHARQDIPRLLDERDRLQAALEDANNDLYEAVAERDKYKPYFERCMDCPIVCGKETYLMIMNENAELIAERDRLQAELVTAKEEVKLNTRIEMAARELYMEEVELRKAAESRIGDIGEERDRLQAELDAETAQLHYVRAELKSATTRAEIAESRYETLRDALNVPDGRNIHCCLYCVHGRNRSRFSEPVTGCRRLWACLIIWKRIF